MPESIGRVGQGEVPVAGAARVSAGRDDLVLEYLDRVPTLQSLGQRLQLRLRVFVGTLLIGSGLFAVGHAFESRPLLSLGVLGGLFAVLVASRLPSGYSEYRRLGRELEAVRLRLEESGGVPSSGAT